MKKKVWTKKKDRQLKAEYPTANLSELAAALGVTVLSVKGRAQKLGIRRSVNIKHQWTAEEDAYLRERYASTDTKEIASALGMSHNAVYNRANSLGLFKTSEYKKTLYSQTNALNGVKCRFQKGHIPSNKGKKAWQFRSDEASAKIALTQFAKGHTPHNAKPVGYETLRSDGYIYIKVAEGKRMVQKHIWLWEQHHSPVPSNMIVTFIDGDRMHCTIDNLQLSTRSEAVRRMLSSIPQERRQEILRNRNAKRNETIRKDKMRIRWGLEPKTKLVKRWHEPTKI